MPPEERTGVEDLTAISFTWMVLEFIIAGNSIVNHIYGLAGYYELRYVHMGHVWLLFLVCLFAHEVSDQPSYNFPRIEWTNIVQMIDSCIVSTYMRILLVGILGWQHLEVCNLAVVTHVTWLKTYYQHAQGKPKVTCTFKVIDMVIFRIPESVNAMSSRKRIMLCSAEILLAALPYHVYWKLNSMRLQRDLKVFLLELVSFPGDALWFHKIWSTYVMLMKPPLPFLVLLREDLYCCVVHNNIISIHCSHEVSSQTSICCVISLFH